MGTRKRMTSALALALCLGVLTVTSPSAATPPPEGGQAPALGEDAEVPHTAPNGDPYDHAAAQVVVAASDAAIALGSEPGFAGVVIEDDESKIRVQWHGEPNAAALAQLDKMRGAGIPTRVEQARYSRNELIELARETSLMRDPTLTEPWSFNAHPMRDAAGLVAATKPVMPSGSRTTGTPTRLWTAA